MTGELAGLGRLHIPDERDKNHLMRVAAPPKEKTFRNWMVPGGADDQLDTPHCVAFSCEAWLRAHPVVNAHRAGLTIDKVKLYREAQTLDPWPGTNYDGTSVRAGFKALQRMGYITEYVWAWDVETIIRHLLLIGPVVVGTTWYRYMMDTDRYGYIEPRGENYGGHAYLLTAVNTRRKNPDGTVGAFRMQNSWGKYWGQASRAWISIEHMRFLIEYDYGEASAAVEKRVRLAA